MTCTTLPSSGLLNREGCLQRMVPGELVFRLVRCRGPRRKASARTTDRWNPRAPRVGSAAAASSAPVRGESSALERIPSHKGQRRGGRIVRAPAPRQREGHVTLVACLLRRLVQGEAAPLTLFSVQEIGVGAERLLQLGGHQAEEHLSLLHHGAGFHGDRADAARDGRAQRVVLE